MKVFHKKWTDQMDGTSTDWANLPTRMEMEVEIPSKHDNMMVLVSMSRVQHDQPQTNTVFRVVVDGNELAFTNTGGADGWQFAPIDLIGYTAVDGGETVDVSVEYRTQRGTVMWPDDANAPQERQLIVQTSS